MGAVGLSRGREGGADEKNIRDECHITNFEMARLQELEPPVEGHCASTLRVESDIDLTVVWAAFLDAERRATLASTVC